MSVGQDPRTGKWFYRFRVRGVDGSSARLFRSPFDSKEEALAAECDAYFEWRQGTAVVKRRLVGPTKKPTDAEGLIYFVRSDFAIKIGFTKLGLWERFSTLQTANPVQLELLGYIHGTTADELKLHDRFTHLHVRGEWFRAEGDLLEFVKTVKRYE